MLGDFRGGQGTRDQPMKELCSHYYSHSHPLSSLHLVNESAMFSGYRTLEFLKHFAVMILFNPHDNIRYENIIILISQMEKLILTKLQNSPKAEQLVDSGCKYLDSH